MQQFSLFFFLYFDVMALLLAGISRCIVYAEHDDRFQAMFALLHMEFYLAGLDRLTPRFRQRKKFNCG